MWGEGDEGTRRMPRSALCNQVMLVSFTEVGKDQEEAGVAREGRLLP